MNKTFEEKVEVAKKIRASGKTSKIPKECEDYMEKVDIEDCHCMTRNGDTHYYLIKPKQKKALAPLILNLHGGGFCQGHARRDNIFSAIIACKTGAVVIDLDYMLAPEHPFPIAYQEGYDLLKWAYEHADALGVDKTKFVTCGHSAGGNLAAVIAMEAVRTKEFKIRLEILDYPPTDMVTDPADKPETDLTPSVLERLRAFNSLYTDEPGNPYVSIVLAPPETLKDMPETLVITAGHDMLHYEGEKFAFKLADAGVKVTMKKFINSVHGFVIYCIGDEWQKAHDLIVETICNIK